MIDTKNEYVLVRGVVYTRRLGWEGDWHRASMPPDAAPGVRSKWPPKYGPRRLPKHELVDEERAKELIDASLSRLNELGVAR